MVRSRERTLGRSLVALAMDEREQSARRHAH
jgi:hypothetical protein